MNWENYFIRTGKEFSEFWNEYLKTESRNILFVLGVGFDPRTTVGIEAIYSIKSIGKRDTTILRYYKNNEQKLEQNDARVQIHISKLEKFLSECKYSPYRTKDIILRSLDDKNITAINSCNAFNIEDIEGYSDIVVDISAMPRGVFLPLLNKLLSLIEKKNNNLNLHVIITENSIIDSNINDIGEADEAVYIHGLGVTDTARTRNHKEIWIVLLGEGQTKQFEIIKKDIDAAEICPVLPFPSLDLKRGDKLIIEYQDLLLNDLSFDPKNIIYANESNPFQMYRLIYQATKRYYESLNILGGCKIVLSALASKSMTIGAFLAVYESKKKSINIGIKQVETIEHQFNDGIESKLSEILKKNNLVELWITGTPYEK